MLGRVVLNQFLEDLDPQRYFWTEQAVKQIDREDGAHFMQDLHDGNLAPAFSIANRYEKQVQKRLAFALKAIQGPMSFTRKGRFTYVRNKLPWPADAAKLDQIWRERIKSDLITLLLDGKSLAVARQILAKRYQTTLKRASHMSPQRLFDILMMAFAKSLDPHTSYFSPLESQQFQIAMSLQLQGIGAQLIMHNGYATIVRLLPGGPARASKLLHPGDRITAVGQGLKGKLVDVVGWRLEDIVEKIRGPKNTAVRLKVLPAGDAPGAHEPIITLVRQTIQLKGQAAKAKTAVIHIGAKAYHIGIITLPTFYLNFQAKQDGSKNYRSTSRDMKKLILKLLKKHIQGLIVDLRDNGGGSLEEALKTTGLFTGRGPVVQIESAGGLTVLKSPRTPAVYRGPLVVMVNRLSASASEIFTAALKDYHRALIVGSRTYGKATVQTLLNLNRYLPGFHAGELKLTIAKFYRITGDSTQDRGVRPQIAIPSTLSDSLFGEELSPHALLWSHIPATTYHPFRFGLVRSVPQLDRRFTEWSRNNPKYTLYAQGVAHILRDESMTSLPLSLQQRRILRKHDDSIQLKLDNEWLRLDHHAPVQSLRALQKIKGFHIPDMPLRAAEYLAAQMYRMHLELNTGTNKH
ncbi:periplasmic tail-specific protease [mine drainage metagenome]|uniref:Periplasmic tail-specific protease n=3 Tax=mine drainage metagenome TaxID=410659 RepID=T1BV30_9ZZZZ